MSIMQDSCCYDRFTYCLWREHIGDILNAAIAQGTHGMAIIQASLAWQLYTVLVGWKMDISSPA